MYITLTLYIYCHLGKPGFTIVSSIYHSESKSKLTLIIIFSRSQYSANWLCIDPFIYCVIRPLSWADSPLRRPALTSGASGRLGLGCTFQLPDFKEREKSQAVWSYFNLAGYIFNFHSNLNKWHNVPIATLFGKNVYLLATSFGRVCMPQNIIP